MQSKPQVVQELPMYAAISLLKLHQSNGLSFILIFMEKSPLALIRDVTNPYRIQVFPMYSEKVVV